MLYTSDNIKYALLSFSKDDLDNVHSYSSGELFLSGLFQWRQVFKGKYLFPVFPSDCAVFNVIHVNITPNNLPLVWQLLPLVNRNTCKLVFNVDHSVHLWHSAFEFPHIFLKTLDLADHIFGVEEIMCEILSDALKRPVSLIPHPVDVDRIKALSVTDRAQRIGVSLHRYNGGNTVLPWYAINDLPDGWIVSVIGACSQLYHPSISHLYPEVQPHLDFPDLIRFLSGLYAVIESYTISSFGRLTIECAALGVPVIGEDIVNSQKRCFPELSTSHFNPVVIKKLLNELISNPDFYSSVCRFARLASDYYSLDNSRVRFLNLINGV